MKSAEHFIRFDGRLWENMSFKHRTGWETNTIALRPKEGDGTFLLELRDKSEKVLVQVSPKVDFHNVCREKLSELLSTRVTAYIPTHPVAREIVFRRGKQFLFRENISKYPPTIGITSIKKLKGNKIKISWEAKHREDKKLSFNLMYTSDDERTFVLANNLKKNSLTLDLNKLVGSKFGKISILATDGIRSAYTVSKDLELPFKAPEIVIKSPKDRAILPVDQPVSLCGYAIDIGGMRMPDSGLVWYLDGEKLSEGKWLSMAEKLEPGEHFVKIQYVLNKKVVTEKEVRFRISERGKKQMRYLKVAGIARDERLAIGTWPTPE